MQTTTIRLAVLLLSFAFFHGTFVFSVESAVKRPNIVMILVDDLGNS